MVHNPMLHRDERKILRELQRDCTQSARDLAEKLNLSPSTVWRRMKEMEEAGIISGRVALADPKKLGLDVCLLIHVNIASQTSGSREAFEVFVNSHESILQCYAVTGGYDYILVVRLATVDAFEDFLMNEVLAHPSVANTRTQLVLQQMKNSTALPV